MIVSFYLYFLSRVTDIEDEHPSQKEIPDLFFPVAQADVYECSTYAVVCRLKSSPTYTITSTGGLFSHPDYPGVMVTIPENAVAPESPFTLELKVGLIKKVHFFLYKDSIDMRANKISPTAFQSDTVSQKWQSNNDQSSGLDCTQ